MILVSSSSGQRRSKRALTLFGLFDPVYEGTTVFENIGNYLHVDMM